MDLEAVFEDMGIDRNDYRDLHITRFFSSFVAVSDGKVIGVTEPFLKYCPLAESLYEGEEREQAKERIVRAIEEKIERFGYFTESREIERSRVIIPYGASEMMMYALRKKVVDCAVVACEGAGSVITDKPEIVQGIGARMNGLFYTSCIGAVAEKLEKSGSHVVFPRTADIKQVAAVEKAAELGYKKIVVTVSALMDEDLSSIREIENKYGISVVSLVVCTTGVTRERTLEMEKHVDLVWACASAYVRDIIGRRAVLQVSTKIPVFVLTEKGIKFVSGYSRDEGILRTLDFRKQYLISGNHQGRKITMGRLRTYLGEANLPVRSEKEPS